MEITWLDSGSNTQAEEDTFSTFEEKQYMKELFNLRVTTSQPPRVSTLL